MKKTVILLFIAASCFSVTSCETTGDPAAGGFFGWSEQKSNARIAERQEVLEELGRSSSRY